MEAEVPCLSTLKKDDETVGNNEVTDSPRQLPNHNVSYIEILWTCLSFLLKLGSIGLNIKLIRDYYAAGDTYYALATIVCAITPLLINIALSLQMYCDDVAESKIEKKPWYYVVPSIIMVPFFPRYWQPLILQFKCKSAELNKKPHLQKKLYSQLVNEESDAVLFRIFECFFEAAPQKTLQISIYLMRKDDLSIDQELLIIFALFRIAFCIVSYNRSVRRARPEKNPISLEGLVLMFFWHICITVSRISAICAIASIFLAYTSIALGVHAFCMAIWIFVCDKSPFCSDHCDRGLIFSLALGFVFIFVYILPREMDTKYRYITYYLICGAENLAAVVLYYIFAQEFAVLCWLSVGLFIVGIAFMIIYYRFFHPNVLDSSTQPIAMITNFLKSNIPIA